MTKKSPHDSPPPEEITRAHQESIERIIDHTLETLIITHGKRVNEGNNGVIFRLHLGELQPGEIEKMKTQGIELGEEQAAKILKVYFAGNGRREFDLQQQAYQMTENLLGNHARIPRPILYRDILLTSEGKSELQRQGIRTGSRAEIILMEFIPGIDLATLLYRQALQRRYPELYPTIEDVSSMNIEILGREVASALGFERPGGKGTSEAARISERRKVETANAKKLYDFLRRQGFVLDPAILEGLKHTIRHLHEGGIIHRDVHERNIMITDPYESTKRRVYLVDFGSARRFIGPYREKESTLYEDALEGVVYIQDEMPLRLLEPLTHPLNEEKREEAKREANRYLKDVMNLDRDVRWEKRKAEILANLSSENLNTDLFNLYHSLVHQPEEVRYYISVVVACLQNKRISKEKVEEIVRSLLQNKSIQIRARNLLQTFLRALPSLETEN